MMAATNKLGKGEQKAGKVRCTKNTWNISQLIRLDSFRSVTWLAIKKKQKKTDCVKISQ